MIGYRDHVQPNFSRPAQVLTQRAGPIRMGRVEMEFACRPAAGQRELAPNVELNRASGNVESGPQEQRFNFWCDGVPRIA